MNNVGCAVQNRTQKVVGTVQNLKCVRVRVCKCVCVGRCVCSRKEKKSNANNQLVGKVNPTRQTHPLG